MKTNLYGTVKKASPENRLKEIAARNKALIRQQDLREILRRQSRSSLSLKFLQINNKRSTFGSEVETSF